MPHSTLKATLLDRLHEQADDRETRWIACQEAARSFGQQVAEVLTGYDFSRDEQNCLLLANGTAMQCAMLLTDKTSGKSLSVACKADGEDFLWYILDMANTPYTAAVYIAAVKARIAANRSSKAVN